MAALPVVLWFSVGKSPATAILGTPVDVVFFRMPVASPERLTPFIFTTVTAPDTAAEPSNAVVVNVASPVPEIVRAVVSVAADPVVFWLRVGKSPATAMVSAPVDVVLLRMPVASADVPAL